MSDDNRYARVIDYPPGGQRWEVAYSPACASVVYRPAHAGTGGSNLGMYRPVLSPGFVAAIDAAAYGLDPMPAEMEAAFFAGVAAGDGAPLTAPAHCDATGDDGEQTYRVVCSECGSTLILADIMEWACPCGAVWSVDVRAVGERPRPPSGTPPAPR